MNISVILPCYNEIESLPAIRDDLLAVLTAAAAVHAVELVLVDDGSTDGTRACAAAMFSAAQTVCVRIVGHPTNRGLGAALRTGFANARGEVLVTTDCDGTFDFRLIPELLARLEPGVDIVTASPHHPLGGLAGVPPLRRLLSRSCSALYRVLVTGEVHTYTSLFRAYRRGTIQSISFESDGFLAGTELLVRALLGGHRIAELPVTLCARPFGLSKIQLGRTMLEHLRFMARLALHRLSIRRLPA